MNTATLSLNEIKTVVTDAIAEQLGDLPISDIIDTRARQSRDRMLRIASVTELTGLSKSTIYALEVIGDFPNRVPLTSNTSAWSELEVQNWIADRKNNRDRTLLARGRRMAVKS